MKKFIFIFLSLILAFTISIALGGISIDKKVKETNSSAYENAIVYNINKLPNDLILMDSYDMRQKDILSNLFSGLVSMDEEGNIIPDLAQSWKVNSDKTQYVFTIRKNAKWSDGKRIKAQDFVDFFSSILDSNVNNVYSHQLSCIFGVEEYRKNSGNFSNVAIKALNDSTLQIRLNYSSDYFLNILAQPIYSLRKVDENLIYWKKNYSNIAYSGSFKINNIMDNGNVELKKNNDYWNSKNVKAGRIIITCFNSGEGALAAYHNNVVNVFTDPPISEIKSIENVAAVSSYSGEALTFNIKKSANLDDANFRKAIALSINRKNIVQDILENKVDASISYLPYYSKDKLSYNYANIDNLLPQTNKAKEFMKQSNYRDDGEPLKIIYINTVENKKICDVIAKNIKDVLGIKTISIGYSKDTFWEKVKGKDYDIAKISYTGNYYYPLDLLDSWRSNSEMNFYGYKNNEFDSKLLEAVFDKNNDERLTKFKEAEKLLLDDTVVIPLYFNNTIICSKSYVRGIYMNKLGNIKLDRAYLSK